MAFLAPRTGHILSYSCPFVLVSSRTDSSIALSVLFKLVFFTLPPKMTVFFWPKKAQKPPKTVKKKKQAPESAENEFKTMPKRTTQRCQNDPKVTPKRPRVDPKMVQNHPKMTVFDPFLAFFGLFCPILYSEKAKNENRSKKVEINTKSVRDHPDLHIKSQ